jgi:hypothetical protein
MPVKEAGIEITVVARLAAREFGRATDGQV